MTSHLRDIPEVAALDGGGALVRIPPEIDVPFTPRVRAIIDTSDFRRLAHISQLGLVALVYPAAHHTRFEHSLGVYRLALLFLRHLSHDPRFRDAIAPADGELFLAAALLHDLGHWPFCHPIEDMRLPGVPEHELLANSFLLEGEIGDVLRDEWRMQPREIVALLSEKARDQRGKILSSMLSGPIDIDKMDYLARDSLHAGVPYGRNFDQGRLIASLCLNAAGDGLAISDKGKTAAELMVFARYVMFSEVYWHHAVRSATAMLQRAFYLLQGSLDLDVLFRLTETAMIERLARWPKARRRPIYSRGCLVPRGGFTSAWRSTISSRSASCTTDWPASPIPGWRPAASASPRGPAARSAGSWPRMRFSSTPRRPSARCSSIFRCSTESKTAIARWAKCRRCRGHWPTNSSTIM